jgi:translation initiation factor 6 (eIF-6)
MRNFSTIVMACCEKGMSFEESLNKVLLNEEVTLEEIREVVKALPSNVRMVWSKNTADGFIAFCQTVTATVSGTTTKAQKEPSEE